MHLDQTMNINSVFQQRDNRKCQFVCKTSTTFQCVLLPLEVSVLQFHKKENTYMFGEQEYLANCRLQIESRKFKDKFNKCLLAPTLVYA